MIWHRWPVRTPARTYYASTGIFKLSKRGLTPKHSASEAQHFDHPMPAVSAEVLLKQKSLWETTEWRFLHAKRFSLLDAAITFAVCMVFFSICLTLPFADFSPLLDFPTHDLNSSGPLLAAASTEPARNASDSTAQTTTSVPRHLPESVRRSELDIVVAVYDEEPRITLQLLEKCCPTSTCQVYIYLSWDPAATRSHGASASHHYTEVDWQALETTYAKHVTTVNNSWTGTEATAYMTHIVEQYSALGKTLAFVHGHASSWHSDNLCDIITRGRSLLSSRISYNNDSSVYINLNKPYPRRCVSQTGFSGLFATEKLRDNIYANWTSWTGAPVPRRFSWECCAQFVTTDRSIRGRGHEFWKQVLHTMEASPAPWEYLWPTMIDEKGTIKLADC